MKKLYLILLVPLLLVACDSCSWWNSTGKQLVDKTFDCSVQATAGEANKLLPKVLSILTGGSPNWSAELDELKGAGLDILGCALQSAYAVLDEKSQPTPGVQGGLEAEKRKAQAIEGKRKAKEYVTKQGFQYKGAK